MKRKSVLFLAVLLFTTTILAAGTLSISSVSFKDSFSNPVEKDYQISSYRVEGKNMPNPSTIAGQFSKTFDEIPFKVENLPDGDNWKIKVSAYDNNGRLVGTTGDITVAIKDKTAIDANIIVDVPSFKLNEIVVASKGEYVPIEDLYDVDHYELTFTNLNGSEEYVETTNTLPYIKALDSGRWSIVIEAIDKDGRIIASSGRQGFGVGDMGTVNAKIALSVRDKYLKLETSGTNENNGYIYLENDKDFSINANVYPLGKDDSISYQWYITENGEWKDLENHNESSLSYKDIKGYIKEDETFSILCNPVLNDRVYSGSVVTISPVPELVPVLYITGSNPLELDGKNNSLDIVTTEESVSFAIDVPTYYLGSGLKVYYTLDGTKPTEESSQLTIGKSVSFDTGKKELKLLLVDSNGKNHDYTIKLDIISKAATPSVSISNRDWGRDLYATLSTRTDGAKIYYTVDGTEPDEDSLEYTEPFKVGTLLERSNTVIKAIAIKDGYENSNVTTVKSY